MLTQRTLAQTLAVSDSAVDGDMQGEDLMSR
jgi:hypothetical protein